MIERWKNLKLSRKSTKKLHAGEWDDMPAWMRAKKSVPEKHAGNELNEEKHMCFAI